MKKFFLLFCMVCFYAIASAQQKTDYSSSVSSYKTKYPKAEIIAADIKEEYNFNIITNKNGDTKVGADIAQSQVLVPLKDYINYTDAVFYDEESSVDNVHASSAKTKTVKFLQQCSDYESEGIFYSDLKACVIKIPSEEKGIAIN